MEDTKYDVIVVGELNVDLILNKIESLPELGKEKIAGEMNLTLGSSSAIFACNLSSLGAKVSFLGKIGKDFFGEFVIEELQKKNVDVSNVIKDGNCKTGATIILNYSEDRAMITHPGAMAELAFDDIKVENLLSAKHLHFSSFYLQPALRNSVVYLFKFAKKNGLTTSFDMQWDPNEKWDMDYKNILPYVDVFFPNEQELLLLTKENDVIKGLEKLSKYGNNIVVKMGSKGSISWSNNKTHYIDAFINDQVVDAIGAGDSFNAGFIYKFIQGKDIIECQKFGNLMGAINTTAAGGTGAFSNYNEIMRLAKDRFKYVD